jgi:tRNA C32,U32 (ribose-2'-O)-methylase TrmJ
MNEYIKIFLTMLCGALIPSVFNRFLNKRKQLLEEALLQTTDCEKNMEILRSVIEQLREELDRVKKSMSDQAATLRLDKDILQDNMRNIMNKNMIQEREINLLKTTIVELKAENAKFHKLYATKAKSQIKTKPKKKVVA